MLVNDRTIIRGRWRPPLSACIRRLLVPVSALSVFAVFPLLAMDAGSAPVLPWWGWALILFVITIGLGIIAVLGGVGGVLFVPIVSAVFPFHIDFVRGAGLLMALSGSLSASPALLRKGLANIRLALPAALIASTASIAGAFWRLALPTNIVQIALGATIFSIAVVMLLARKSLFPAVREGNPITQALVISGVYHEPSKKEHVPWTVFRTRRGFFMFIVIGLLAGMLGLGAGWANVPVLNLIMGAPLKVAVGTSMFLLSSTDTSAAWIFINRGAVLPVMLIPSVSGMIIGTKIGALLLPRVKPSVVRWIVIVMLCLAGVRALLKGFGI